MFMFSVAMSFAVVVVLTEHVLVAMFSKIRMFINSFHIHWLHFAANDGEHVGDAHVDQPEAVRADAEIQVEIQVDLDNQVRIARMNAEIEQLGRDLAACEQEAYNYMELHEHAEEELRAVRWELRELREAVEEHRERNLCPLGRPVYKTRFGSHWHCNPQCRHIVERNPEAIAPCLGCSNHRPLWRPGP